MMPMVLWNCRMTNPCYCALRSSVQDPGLPAPCARSMAQRQIGIYAAAQKKAQSSQATYICTVVVKGLTHWNEWVFNYFQSGPFLALFVHM